jgi:intracellular sulfur oxidation DsrE/DsrF family protein
MTDRRTFLTTTALAGASSLAAVAAQAPVVAAAAAPEANASSILTKAGIVSLLRKDAAERQVFATVPLKGGVLLHYLVNWLQATQVSYGNPPAATHAVAVMYGSSLAMMLDDAFWDAYVTDAVVAQLEEKLPNRGKGNPFLHPKPGADPAKSDDVTTLLSRGVTFLVCANAFMGAAGMFSRLPNFPKDKPAFDTLRAALIPGAYLVPAGVAAVTTVQQNGYTFFQASIG